MAHENAWQAATHFTARVERAYRRLIDSPVADGESGLGGKLLYAGELDGEGGALLAAANIAGAASLAATADRAVQKQAMRDGIADFLVNSLDESLRILKNQLRKREAVSVCVGLAPEAAKSEMDERGVQPDLLRSEILPKGEAQSGFGSAGSAIVTWSVAWSPAQWLPKLDAMALDCLDAGQWQSRRWLRLAPRYLGRLAQGTRLMRCAPHSAAKFVELAGARVANGEIAVAVVVRVTDSAGHEREWRLEPGGDM